MKRKYSLSSENESESGNSMLEAYDVGWRHTLEKNVFIEIFFIVPIFVNSFALMISHFGQDQFAFMSINNIAYFCLVISFLEVSLHFFVLSDLTYAVHAHV